jgi:F0F1-type ATP synthase alpha subunit
VVLRKKLLLKKITKALRLELAQYNELFDFAQFSTELEEKEY